MVPHSPALFPIVNPPYLLAISPIFLIHSSAYIHPWTSCPPSHPSLPRPRATNADPSPTNPFSGLFASLTGTVKRAATPPTPAKNAGAGTVFVAGATGKLGSRVVRELVKDGNRVRAGVRDLDAAADFLDQAITAGSLTQAQASRIDLVPFDLTDPTSYDTAVGGATRVVCAAAYSGPISKPGGFTEIDGKATISFIKYCRDLGTMDHFVLVTSLGTATPFRWPYIAFNLFGGKIPTTPTPTPDNPIPNPYPYPNPNPNPNPKPKPNHNPHTARTPFTHTPDTRRPTHPNVSEVPTPTSHPNPMP